jgi:hypothetical protein
MTKVVILAAASLIFASTNACAQNFIMQALAEIVTAAAYPDNYKRFPGIVHNRMAEHEAAVQQNNTDLTQIIYSENCRHFDSATGPGKACLVDDGTWEIVEQYKK